MIIQRQPEKIEKTLERIARTLLSLREERIQKRIGRAAITKSKI
jgi:hypothetical protein